MNADVQAEEMQMRDLFSEVLDLQKEFSSENTPSMQRRGNLIRGLIPTELQTWPAVLSETVEPYRGPIDVEGRDGTGRKTFIPWVRVYSPELSPSPQRGWYAVYLFEPEGEGVSLCLSHGSTQFDGHAYVPRPPAEIEPLLAWARDQIESEALRNGFRQGVDLRAENTLGRAYERSTAYSKRYEAANLPNDRELSDDLNQAMRLLGVLYQKVQMGRGPGTEPPEIAEVRQIAAPLKRPGTGGQGFGLSAEERRAVERRAMEVAREWLVGNGYERIVDTSATSSFDLTAVRGGVEFVVEVKGTTTNGDAILITAAEVRIHENRYPHNILIVVREIELINANTAARGSVQAHAPWDTQAAQFEPISYRCKP